jgi:hypothetical protein
MEPTFFLNILYELLINHVNFKSGLIKKYYLIEDINYQGIWLYRIYNFFVSFCLIMKHRGAIHTLIRNITMITHHDLGSCKLAD